MPNKIKVEVCRKCKGKGGFPATGKVCDECRGTGLIGTDGTYEYYLGDDGKGKLKVVDIKTSPSTITSSPPQQQRPSSPTQRRNVFKMLLILILIISYIGFLGIYLAWIQTPKVFWVITIIFLGVLFLFLSSNVKLLGSLISSITHIILKEPDDFLTAIKNQSKEQTT